MTDRAALSVVLLHAHPDDESLFTGVLARRLADRGHVVTLVTATGGEMGTSRRFLVNRARVRRRRVAELDDAAAILGIGSRELLGYRDSGMAGEPGHDHPDAFVNADPAAVAQQLAAITRRVGADVLVHYDDTGIYGHPDHLMVHRVGRLVAEAIEVPSYECALDRDHLAATGPHYVEGPRAAAQPPLVGRSADEITTDLRPDPTEVEAKRAAMAAHASQLDASVVRHPRFAALYGPEWYVRVGDPVLESAGVATGR